MNTCRTIAALVTWASFVAVVAVSNQLKKDISDFSSKCCSPGYISTPDDGCMCGSTQDSLHIVRCDDSNGTKAFIRGGTWVGYVPSTNHPGECSGSNTSFYVGTCPNGYCANEGHKQFALPHNRSVEELDRLICGETRTGILCGQCREGYGPGVNLFLAPCVDCKNDPLSQFGWLLWIVLEFVPLCIMLFVVLYFNIDFLSGPFNSYWLYIQIVNSSFPVSTVGPIPISNTPLSIFLRLMFIVLFGIFDLQFFTFLFPPFCLSQNGIAFDTLDMMVFKSATRIFPLLVIAFVIVYHTCRGRGSLSCTCACVQSCQCFCCLKICQWWTSRISIKSALHGLAAFFVLVYCHFLTYCGNLFGRHVISSSNPNAPDITVLHLQGTMRYFYEAKHVVYSSVTLLLILFVVLPPAVLLLLYPSLHQVQQAGVDSSYKFLQEVCKVKVFGIFNTPRVQQFADLFQSCYKNNYRFFAGILLLSRIAIIMVWNLVGNRSAGFAVLAVLSLCLLLLHSLLQPNKKKWINILDTLIYAHMTAMNLLAVYVYSNGAESQLASIQSLYLVAIFIPAAYPMLFMARKIYTKLLEHRKLCVSSCTKENTTESEMDMNRYASQPSSTPGPSSTPTPQDSQQDPWTDGIDRNHNNELWWST